MHYFGLHLDSSFKSMLESKATVEQTNWELAGQKLYLSKEIVDYTSLPF